MKKLFASLLMLTLCSCSSPEPTKSTAPPEQQTTTSVIAETVTEPETTATEIPPAPTTEPPTEPEVNELLYDDQGFKIYYQGVDQNIVNFYIENNSEQYDLHSFIQNISVNGYSLESFRCEGYAAKNYLGSWQCTMPLEELQSREITRINELKFTIYMYAGNWQFETEEFTITR